MRITEVGRRNGIRALLVEDTGGHPDWRPVVAGTHPVRGVVGKVSVKDPVAGVVGAKLDIEEVTRIDGLGCLPGLRHRMAILGHHHLVVSVQLHGVGLLGGVIDPDPDKIAFVDGDRPTGGVSRFAVDGVERKVANHNITNTLSLGSFFLEDLGGIAYQARYVPS